MDAAILHFFESIRTPWLSAILSAFSLLGEATLVGGVAILVFWLAPKRTGEQIVMTVLTSFTLNSVLKFTAARPRPFVKGVVEYEAPAFASELEPYESFPSGHTQSSSSFLFSAADTQRCRFWRVVSVVLVALVMIARVYFGAHYPSDVLAGLLFALVAALLWAVIFRYAYGARYFFLLFFAGLSLIPCFFFYVPSLPQPSHDYVQSVGPLTGAAVALALGELFFVRERKTTLLRRLNRIPVGIAVVAVVFVFAIFFPEGEAYSLLKWFLIAFSAGLLAPVLFDLLEI